MLYHVIANRSKVTLMGVAFFGGNDACIALSISSDRADLQAPRWVISPSLCRWWDKYWWWQPALFLPVDQ